MGFVAHMRKSCTPATVGRYMGELERFHDILREAKGAEGPKNATHRDIMGHIGRIRESGRNPSTALCAIKKYHAWLLGTGQRGDDPARGIRLRDSRRKDIQLQDLFTRRELERLLTVDERYTLLRNRNRALLSLLAHQGLTNGEVRGLRTSDIDTERGTVNIRAGARTDARELKLDARQAFWLMAYIGTDRPGMLKGPTDALFINQRGSPETANGIAYLLSARAHLFPGRKLTATTVRQSVIANLLKEGKDLRLVQAFAGHRHPGTTERYRQAHIEELRNEVTKHHPLG